jgi:hypothetical protein
MIGPRHLLVEGVPGTAPCTFTPLFCLLAAICKANDSCTHGAIDESDTTVPSDDTWHHSNKQTHQSITLKSLGEVNATDQSALWSCLCQAPFGGIVLLLPAPHAHV